VDLGATKGEKMIFKFSFAKLLLLGLNMGSNAFFAVIFSIMVTHGGAITLYDSTLVLPIEVALIWALTCLNVVWVGRMVGGLVKK
jgi:hypothetical protein